MDHRVWRDGDDPRAYDAGNAAKQGYRYDKYTVYGVPRSVLATLSYRF